MYDDDTPTEIVRPFHSGEYCSTALRTTILIGDFRNFQWNNPGVLVIIKR